MQEEARMRVTGKTGENHMETVEPWSKPEIHKMLSDQNLEKSLHLNVDPQNTLMISSTCQTFFSTKNNIKVFGLALFSA